LHHLIYRFHRSILILTTLLTLIAIIFASRLELDLDLFALLPSDNPGVNTFFEITDEIGLQSLLIALVVMPPEFDRGKAEHLIDLLAKNYSQSPLIRDVQYKSGGEEFSALFHAFMEHLPLLLNFRDLKKLAFLLSDPEINSRVNENKRLLMTPFGIVAKEMVYVDPLSLRDLLKPDALSRPGKRSARALEGFFKTREGGTYFLFLKPKSPPQDVEFSKKLMAETRRLEKISLSEFHNQFGYLPKKIKISFTGGYPIAVNDEATTKKDMKITLLTSFLGVMILFGLSFRTFNILFYVGLPLALSILWTLGFASLAFHHLNILTCIFSCVLIGLGIDFAIHIVNRYFDQDNVSLDVLPGSL
jgi:predicted RND superfamily exporter protein